MANMKKLIYIMGGQATGKMTVGEELAKITGLKLFHNHMAVELAHQMYDYGTELSPEQRTQHKKLFAELREDIREVIHRNIAKSFHKGLITTFVMHYDEEYDWQLVEHYKKKII